MTSNFKNWVLIFIASICFTVNAYAIIEIKAFDPGEILTLNISTPEEFAGFLLFLAKSVPEDEEKGLDDVSLSRFVNELKDFENDLPAYPIIGEKDQKKQFATKMVNINTWQATICALYTIVALVPCYYLMNLLAFHTYKENSDLKIAATTLNVFNVSGAMASLAFFLYVHFHYKKGVLDTLSVEEDAWKQSLIQPLREKIEDALHETMPTELDPISNKTNSLEFRYASKNSTLPITVTIYNPELIKIINNKLPDFASYFMSRVAPSFEVL